MLDGYAYDYITADTRLHNQSALLAGVVILPSADYGDVTLYDGQDASSGRSLGPFQGYGRVSLPIMFAVPVPLNNGLFVKFGSNMTGVLVIWKPLELNRDA